MSVMHTVVFIGPCIVEKHEKATPEPGRPASAAVSCSASDPQSDGRSAQRGPCLLNEAALGKRTCTRPTQKYGQLLDCLHDVQLPTVGGGKQISAPALSLLGLVQAKAETCPLFRENLAGAMQARQNQLRLILYLDEVIVGNPLRPDPSRKAMIAYASFLDFAVLHDEALWMTVGIVRHDDMRACVGRCPAVVRAWVHALRQDTDCGFPVTIEGDSSLVFISAIVLLGDVDQLRNSTGWKGPMGLKPCLKCMNVLAPGRHLPAERVPLRQEDLACIRTHLEEQTVASRLRLHETLLGWKCKELKNSFLSCPTLSQWCPVEHLHFDPMHLYWSNGIVGQQLGLFFSSARKLTPRCLAAMQEYARLWTSMPGCPITAASCVSEKLFRDDADYRGDASQCIAVLPVVVAFSFEVLLPAYPHLTEEVLCLDALLAVGKYVMLAKRRPTCIQLDRLRALQAQHCDLFRRVYGAEMCRPKLHYTWHLAEQFQRWGKLLDCFCAERKHRRFKTYAQGTKRVSGFARVVLLQLAARELENVRPVGTSLAGKSVLVEKECQIFSRLRSREREFAHKQILFLREDLAVEILGGCRRAGSWSLVGLPWLRRPKAGINTSALSRWVAGAGRRWLTLEEALQTKEAPQFYRKDGQDMWLLG